MSDIPEGILQIYKDKARDLPQPTPSAVHGLMAALDRAVVSKLNLGGSQEALDEAFDAVVNHPDSTWTAEVLSYRIRQLYYH